MKFSRVEQWSVPAPEALLRPAVIAALRARRVRIVEHGRGRIEGYSGSQLLARLDVSLVPKRWLPLRISVTLTPDDVDVVDDGSGDDAGTVVAVELEDGLGVGAAGTSSRYDELFDETVAALRRATR